MDAPPMRALTRRELCGVEGGPQTGRDLSLPDGLEHRGIERLARAFPRPKQVSEARKIPLASLQGSADQCLALAAGPPHAPRQQQRVPEHDQTVLGPQIEMPDPH